MSWKAKIDYSGLARTGLEVVANAQNASNQNFEVTQSNGDIIANVVFGNVKAPHIDFKVTADLSFDGDNAIVLGKVHGSDGSAAKDGPFAVRSVSISTGAGEEPTFGVDLVQLPTGATQSICTYPIDIPALTPAHHAITFGAFTFAETADLVLQKTDFAAECDLDPVTINGEPRSADATKGRMTVAATFWSASEDAAPDVTASDGWQITTGWTCSGSDASMFVWTATFTKYLTAS